MKKLVKNSYFNFYRIMFDKIRPQGCILVEFEFNMGFAYIKDDKYITNTTG